MTKIKADFTKDEYGEMNEIRKQWKLSWHDFVLRAVKALQEHSLQAVEVPASEAEKFAGWVKAHQEEHEETG